MPQSQVDDIGRWVPGYRVAPDCGDDFSDLKVRSCPVASSNKLAPLIMAYRRHRAGLYNISEVYPKPTCAVIEALDTLHYNHEAAQIRATERANQEAQHG